MIELHSPGIEPGPPAWQAGTLPKELSRQLILWVVGASHLTARERQNINFASAGIEPASPALQAGTLPKELSRHLILRVSYTPLTRNNPQQHTRTPNNRQQHTTTVHNSTRVHKNTNVPLFKKLWDLIFILKLLSHKKNYVLQFLKQRDINSYTVLTSVGNEIKKSLGPTLSSPEITVPDIPIS